MKKYILCLSAILITACSPAQLLGGAFIKDDIRVMSQQERYELEKQKNTLFYCLLTTELPNPSDDYAVATHNNTWKSLCQPNPSELQQNNPE